MKTLAEYQEQVPNYALSYLINGDSSGIDDEDVRNADMWLDGYNQIADDLGGNVVLSVTDETNAFCRNPAFGLACDTTTVDVLILK